MKHNKFELFLISIFVFTLFGFFCLTIYDVINPPIKDNVIIEVIGINENITSDSVSLHYECVLMCADKFYNSNLKLESCYNQCAKLGVCL